MSGTSRLQSWLAPCILAVSLVSGCGTPAVQKESPAPPAAETRPQSRDTGTPQTSTTARPAGASYYAAADGSLFGSGTADSPWSLTRALSSVGPGDTLILKNGRYGPLRARGSGRAGKPLTLRAETPGKVVLDGKGREPALTIRNQSWLVFDGLTLRNAGENPVLEMGPVADGRWDSQPHHITIRNTAIEGSCRNDNCSAAGILAKDSLLEDVWVWGAGRYSLLLYGATRMTIRRAVIRWDAWDGKAYKPGDPRFGLGVYNTHDSIFENILLLDAGRAPTESDKGAIYVPANDNGNTAPWTDSDNNRFLGIVALNNIGVGAIVEHGYEGGTNDNNRFENFIAWNNSGGGFAVNRLSRNTVLTHATLGANDGATWFNDAGSGVIGNVVENSLVYRNKGKGLWGNVVSRFNNVYGNDSNYEWIRPGRNDYQRKPRLKYLLRLEPGSAGKGDAADGGDRAAKVTQRYINGNLSHQSLWPWPNEKRIQAEMCNAATLSRYGRTGNNTPKWCASGKSLSKYIWEYLGSPCPRRQCDAK